MSALVSDSEAQTVNEPARMSQEQEDQPQIPTIYLPKPKPTREALLEQESTVSNTMPAMESFTLESSSGEEEEMKAEGEDSTVEGPRSPRRSLAKRRGRGRRDRRFSSRRSEFGEGQEDTGHEDNHDTGEMPSTADEDHTTADHGPTEESRNSTAVVAPDKPSIESGSE